MMKELISRLTSPSPTFFKKLQAIGLTLTAIATTLMSLPSMITGFELPATLDKMTGYMMAIGLVIAAVAKTTVADTTVLKSPDEKPVV